MRFLSLVIVSMFLTSCLSMKSQISNRERFSLEKVVKLVPDHVSQDEIQSMFGAADIVTPLSDSDDIAWFYKDKKTGYQKLSLVFGPEKKLHSVLWMVSEDEPEIKLENSKKLFPYAKFVSEEASWENPHAAPGEEFYVDKDNGISITFRKARQEVESVSRYSTNAKPTADRKPAVNYEL